MSARQIGVSACLIAILLLGLSLFGGRGAMSAPGAAPHVQDAWVRLPAVSTRPAGGYFTVHGMAKPDALVAATSPAAQRIEMHSMKQENGVMRMRAETSFALPAKGELAFAPGGNHLMLFGLKPGLKEGDAIPLTLVFQSGAKVETRAAIRAVTSPEPAKAHQH